MLYRIVASIVIIGASTFLGAMEHRHRLVTVSREQIDVVLADFHIMPGDVNASHSSQVVSVTSLSSGSSSSSPELPNKVPQVQVFDLTQETDDEIMRKLGAPLPHSSLYKKGECGCALSPRAPTPATPSPRVSEGKVGVSGADTVSPVSDESSDASRGIRCCWGCLPKVLAYCRCKANAVHPEKKEKK